MPKGYVLCEIDVHDMDLYRQEYMSRSGPAVEAFGGRLSSAGESPRCLKEAAIQPASLSWSSKAGRRLGNSISPRHIRKQQPGERGRPAPITPFLKGRNKR